MHEVMYEQGKMKRDAFFFFFIVCMADCAFDFVCAHYYWRYNPGFGPEQIAVWIIAFSWMLKYRRF